MSLKVGEQVKLGKKDENKQSEVESDDSCRFTLGYWAIRGLADPIRMLLCYANVPYNNVMYTQKGADENYSRAEWMDVKFTLGFSFPNLPYLIDHKNGMKLTESNAILRYIAREFQIGNASNTQKAYEEMLGDVLNDLSGIFANLCYRNYPEGKEEYLANALPAKLKPFEDWMVSNKSFLHLAGDRIAYCDFKLYVLLDMNLKLEGSCLDSYPELCQFKKGFESMEFFGRWKKTGLQELPMNNTIAKFR